MALLALHDVSVRFGSVQALAGVSMRIERGEFIAVGRTGGAPHPRVPRRPLPDQAGGAGARAGAPGTAGRIILRRDGRMKANLGSPSLHLLMRAA